MTNEVKWYVVHTYSGYENKVKANLEKIIENRSMMDVIHEIKVPVQDVIEIKNGQRRNVQRKTYPGYVLIKMEMNDDTWYVVRNTRGVTSFVGPGSKPVALTDEEAYSMGIEIKDIKFDISEGEAVKVTNGPFENSIGVIKEINAAKKSVIVMLSIFGRETPVELSFSQILKV